MSQVSDIKSDITKIYQQVDNQEANQAVIKNSIKVISEEIKNIKDKYSSPRRTKKIDAVLNYDIDFQR